MNEFLHLVQAMRKAQVNFEKDNNTLNAFKRLVLETKIDKIIWNYFDAVEEKRDLLEIINSLTGEK